MGAPQVPGASGRMQRAPHGQRRAPEQLRPSEQSASSQHCIGPIAVSTHVPSPPLVHASPTQRDPIGQSVSEKQHPDVGGIVHEPLEPHAPECHTFTPFDAATQSFEYVLPSQPHTGAKMPGQMPGRGAHAPTPVQTPSGSMQ